MTRIYTFDQIFNFRDFGNYKTQQGALVKPGKLFRSANFNKSTPADLDRLSELDIGLLVDLRHLPERERQPNKWPEAATTRMIEFSNPAAVKSGELAPHEAFVKEDLRQPEDARTYMKNSYRERPDGLGYRSLFSETLKHMARTGDGLVIHCAAGKDRTGTLAAIILSVLGVDSKTIMEDYMLTLKAVDIESFLGPAAKMMSERYGRPYSKDALRPMFGVEPDYLVQSLETIGDMDHYVKTALNITSSEISAIKEAYLMR